MFIKFYSNNFKTTNVAKKVLLYEYNEEDVLKTKIKALNDRFEIGKKTLEILHIEGIGNTSGDIEGIKFFFHPNEHQHHRRHIHCEYSGDEIRVDLDTLEVIDGKPFRKTKMKKALYYIKKNQEELINEWDKSVKYGEPFSYKLIK